MGAPASINQQRVASSSGPDATLRTVLSRSAPCSSMEGLLLQVTAYPSALVNACEQAPGCSAPDLRYALSLTNRFTIEISLENGTSATVAGRMPPWPSPQQQLLRAQPANQGAPEEATSKNLGHALGLDPVPLRCELPLPASRA